MPRRKKKRSRSSSRKRSSERLRWWKMEMKKKIMARKSQWKLTRKNIPRTNEAWAKREQNEPSQN